MNRRDKKAAGTGATRDKSYKQEDLSISVGLYEAFLSRGSVGGDARAVYEHIRYAGKMQQTDRPWVTNQFIQNGIGMGERRVNVAKTLLRKMDLIEPVPVRDEKGRVVKMCTRLKQLPNPGPSPTHAKTARVDRTEGTTHAEIARVDGPPMQPTTRVADDMGSPGPEVLEEETNVLKKKEKEDFHESRTSAVPRRSQVQVASFDFSFCEEMRKEGRLASVNLSFMTSSWWNEGVIDAKKYGYSHPAILRNWIAFLSEKVPNNDPNEKGPFFWKNYSQFSRYLNNQDISDTKAEHPDDGKIHPSVGEAIAKAKPGASAPAPSKLFGGVVKGKTLPSPACLAAACPTRKQKPLQLRMASNGRNTDRSPSRRAQEAPCRRDDSRVASRGQAARGEGG